WAGIGERCDRRATRHWAEITYSIISADATADPNGRSERKPRNLRVAAHHWGLGRCSAVDGNLRPGDVAALVGEQEGHQLRNLLRRPVAVHRHLLHTLLAPLGRAERDHVGVDWAG